MKTLLLMRHAKSSWKDISLSDHQRPLNKRGQRDAPRMGSFIAQEDLAPDTILCSTAKRARLTAELFLETCSFDGEVVYSDSLYHASPSTYLDVLESLSSEIESAMIVGHNPEMDYFLDYYCSYNDHMTTANIAYIQFDIDTWSELSQNTEGKVIRIWRPREL
ncbi:histidine phosphatase family protein [Chloroflexota bacterium]